MQKMKNIRRATIALLIALVPSCSNSNDDKFGRAVAQTNKSMTVRPGGIEKYDRTSEEVELHFRQLYEEWRKKHIDIVVPVINSYYPSYTNNPEFQQMEKMGLEALPLMENRLRRLQTGTRDYKTKNWCDTCFVYAIVEIKKWDPYEITGDVAKVGWTNDMGSYCKLVLDRLDDERTNKTNSHAK